VAEALDAVDNQQLKRSVGVLSLFSTAYGNVGSSIYYALGLVAAHALGLTPFVFLFAGGLFALTAKTYAEGATMFPEAGGSSSFARHGFNEVVSFVAGWALMLDYVITIAISAFFVPHYLGPFLDFLADGPGDVIGGVVVVVALAAVNVRGLGRAAGINSGLALLDIATQIVIIGLGTVLVLSPEMLVEQVKLGEAPTWSQLVFALSISMVAYTGIETIANMAQEERDPGRDLPRAANGVVVAVLGLYIGITVIALSALPVTEQPNGDFTTQLGTTYRDDPILGIVSALDLGWLEPIARGYVGVLAATILLVASNAGLIGISRLSWSLAEHHQLPGPFARLFGPGRTPAVAVVFFAALAIVLILPGEASFLGNLYSFGALLSFTIAHVSLVALRYREPDHERPYRAPWNIRLRGQYVSLTAVIGGAGTFGAWVSLVILHAPARYVGLGWMTVGLVGYFIYRRRLGVDPRRIHRRGLAPPDHLPRFTRDRRGRRRSPPPPPQADRRSGAR
jgi:basic amino acid/polyamine antiporter, APA family